MIAFDAFTETQASSSTSSGTGRGGRKLEPERAGEDATLREIPTGRCDPALACSSFEHRYRKTVE